VVPPRALKKNTPAPGAYVLETLASIRDKRAG
jgi:hypothetical protein